MNGVAEVSELTNRVRSLTLTADNAGDEIILSEIYRVLREAPNTPDKIIVTRDEETCTKVFSWECRKHNSEDPGA